MQIAAILVVAYAVLLFSACQAQISDQCASNKVADISSKDYSFSTQNECFLACVNIDKCTAYAFYISSGVCSVYFCSQSVNANYDEELIVTCPNDASHCYGYNWGTNVDVTAATPADCFRKCVENPKCLSYKMASGGVCKNMIADGEKIDTTVQGDSSPFIRCEQPVVAVDTTTEPITTTTPVVAVDTTTEPITTTTTVVAVDTTTEPLTKTTTVVAVDTTTEPKTTTTKKHCKKG